MGKIIKYKGVSVLKPDNISLSYLKKMIDILGSDFCFSIQNVIDFISKK